ncbi:MULTISPECIES: sugar ABC transporter ATP-binding protein [unclassified Bradyrhizobium]|uniref:sugar ABC transporter ATP-binding protein n=1 Tax=unclassified Bradyrhizobium TaxID=2631580 RepID=UPI0020B212EF|nr:MULTISPECIES: sugar ABC transporter ATP-binding protein [unclassified Bradyrhizobium]MCP3384904.1 sugar ABC transporter ATP-binding protein [Bradyrhizobium sp. CCGUVB4N]MCP3446013.1 sugar ABC transporter ATP-binding protein [Bradyrhizobium sp. CCGUVB14]WFU83595.1 sugar ABC transporter ATP-binding protein [Bradyrhizobium sp. CIAT3101]
MASGALRFDGVVKSFGGTRALKGVSFGVGRGEIVALLGENGAGKSTLIKVLGGIHRPDAGAVTIAGEPYHHAPGGRADHQPVAFIHQDLGLVEWMTVAENVGLAQGFPRTRPFGLIDWRGAEARATKALALVGCDIDPTTRVSSLSRTEKSLVAIARALVVNCDFLVLDEPTASLPADEVERLFAALRRLREQGVGMIYVSHRLDEIFRIADRVVVLRDGQLVGEKAISETSPEDLVRLIVGRPLLDMFEKAASHSGKTRVTVRGLITPKAGPVDFDVREGELLGLVGLRGAGQEDVGRALFGAVAHRGEILIDGTAPDLSSPVTAMAGGIGLVARDRTEESIAASLSIRENAFLNPGASGRGLFDVLAPRREAEEAVKLGALVGLRPNDPHLAIEGLSGGNQQKVVVGRWLATGRKLLVAEDPTAGVDVGAKAEIYRLIARAITEGLAVVVVSTDFEEVAHICHRALVFNRGRIITEIAGDNLTTEALITAASASEAA